MILSLTFFIVTSILIFRSARNNGHNPWFWTAMNFVAFIVAPVFIQILLGVVLGIMVQMEMVRLDNGVTIATLISWVVFGLSIGCVFLIMKKISLVKEGDHDFTPPPNPDQLNLS